jgi:hypothetical protein
MQTGRPQEYRMLPTKETTAADVYAHALNHGDKPVIHGAEIDYDDVHEGVHLHADLLAAADARWQSALAAAEKAGRDTAWAARKLAITVDLAEEAGRSPRSWATYAGDLAEYRAAAEASVATDAALVDASDHRDALRAKRDQDAQATS